MPRPAESVLILCFLLGGQVVLEEDGEQVWASDADEDFQAQFTDEFLDVDDAEDVLEYLVDADVLTEEEAAEVEIDEDEPLSPEEADELAEEAE